MPTAIALIRGINVGSTRSVPMDILRELCVGVGMKEPRTYIQSGNVVFRAASRTTASAPAKLEAALEARFGFRPTVVVRTVDQVAAAIDANPFTERAELEPSRLLLMFLAGPPAPTAGAALGALKRGRERHTLIGRELFLDYPDGVGRSRLTMASIEKAVGVAGTARNWNTVLKLLAMAREHGGAAALKPPPRAGSPSPLATRPRRAPRAHR